MQEKLEEISGMRKTINERFDTHREPEDSSLSQLERLVET